MKDTKGSQALRKLVTPPRVNQQTVAERCKVSQQAVSGWMQGRAKPTPDRMRVLQDEFGIPMEAWTEDPAPEAEEASKSEEPAA